MCVRSRRRGRRRRQPFVYLRRVALDAAAVAANTTLMSQRRCLRAPRVASFANTHKHARRNARATQTHAHERKHFLYRSRSVRTTSCDAVVIVGTCTQHRTQTDRRIQVKESYRMKHLHRIYRSDSQSISPLASSSYSHRSR